MSNRSHLTWCLPSHPRKPQCIPVLGSRRKTTASHRAAGTWMLQRWDLSSVLPQKWPADAAGKEKENDTHHKGSWRSRWKNRIITIAIEATEPRTSLIKSPATYPRLHLTNPTPVVPSIPLYAKFIHRKERGKSKCNKARSAAKGCGFLEGWVGSGEEGRCLDSILLL